MTLLILLEIFLGKSIDVLLVANKLQIKALPEALKSMLGLNITDIELEEGKF